MEEVPLEGEAEPKVLTKRGKRRQQFMRNIQKSRKKGTREQQAPPVEEPIQAEVIMEEPAPDEVNMENLEDQINDDTEI